MISLAGTYLICPTSGLAEWINHHIPLRDHGPLAPRAFPGKALASITTPTAFWPAPDARIGELRWPAGASRWASGYFLASSSQAESIRAAANDADGAPVPLPFRMDSPGSTAGETLATDLYCLQITPLARMDPAGGSSFTNGLYLLTLVDERFYWWNTPTPDFNIGPGTTWTDLWAGIATVLSRPIALDPIDAGYARPSVALNLKFECLPPVIDAVAYSCGLTLVRGLDGSVSAVGNANGQAASDAGLTIARRTRRAGGRRHQRIL